MRGDLAMLRVIDVCRVVVKRGQRPNYSAHDRHGMGVGTKALEKAPQLFVHHGVVLDGINKVRALLRVWKFSIQQQIA